MSTFTQFFPTGSGSSSGGGGGGVPATTTVAEVLVVAGGQSGAWWCCDSNHPGGGGSGGGVLSSSGWSFEQGCTYTVTVGAGGPGTGCGHNPGEDSKIIGHNAPPMALVARTPIQTASSKISAAGWSFSPYHQVDANTYHYGTEQGRNAVVRSPQQYGTYAGSAGGAGHPGCPADVMTDSCPNTTFASLMRHSRQPGGDGFASDISGTMAYYGPGGHGYNNCTTPCAGTGTVGKVAFGACADSTASPSICRPAISCAGCVNTPTANSGSPAYTPACANYGAGGSGKGNGACNDNYNAGGSGVVFIRYPTQYPAASSVSGNISTPAQSGYHVYRFNGDGSIVF